MRNNKINDEYKSTGISLPHNILNLIDKDRGDIPRSRFLLRILQEKYKIEIKQKEKNNSPDNRLENLSDELRSIY
jgi:hypothetical protein